MTHFLMPRFFSLRGLLIRERRWRSAGTRVYRQSDGLFRSVSESIGGFRDGGFVTGMSLVEEVAQCHDVRVSGHGASDALDGQTCGPSQRWKAASMPHSTPISQPVRRHHTLGTLLATIAPSAMGCRGQQ